MNFNDLFRSIFGFSSSPHNYGIKRDDLDDDEEDDDMTTRQWDEDGTFGDLNDQFFRETQEMFSHFQEMFSSFGITEFPQIGFPDIEDGGSLHKSKSPRNEMLKSDEDTDTQKEDFSKRRSNWFSPSNQRPFFGDIFKIPSLDIDSHSNQGKKEDTDLDEHIDSSNLDLIFPNERDKITTKPSRNSFFHSVSVRTIRRPDGTVETHRTENDSHGNVKTTITTTDDNGRPTTIPDNEERPFIRRDQQHQEIPPLKDKHGASIFSKLFGSW